MGGGNVRCCACIITAPLPPSFPSLPSPIAGGRCESSGWVEVEGKEEETREAGRGGRGREGGRVKLSEGRVSWLRRVLFDTPSTSVRSE